MQIRKLLEINTQKTLIYKAQISASFSYASALFDYLEH